MFKTVSATLLLGLLARCAQGHHGHEHEHDERDQAILAAAQAAQKTPYRADAPIVTWAEKYGAQNDLGYTGPLSFSHLDYVRCLQDTNATFDVAILGMPFDTTTTYRPGARFGPTGIRVGSRRQNGQRSYTLAWGLDPYQQGAKVIDCGDVPINGYDNAIAIDQMEVAYSTLLARPVAREVDLNEKVVDVTSALSKDGKAHPRIVTLGGDHTIVLPILRSLNKVYGPVSVIHFDAHLDTWKPTFAGTDQSRITHGTFFYIAAEEGLMRNASIHGGIRTKMNGESDITNDEEVGFKVVSSEDIDDIGVNEVIRRIRNHIGSNPVYLSLDIDVIDPGLAPATGTPEAGGWTTREMKRIIRGLAGLNVVGADLVEVAPAYDHADITSIAAADLVHDFLSMFMSSAPPGSRDDRKPWRDEL
ncbi:Arginase/deacetylase [Amylostereum chailletii]|nr:Arginase/deacetylase [Amylostereum chailletii]